MKEQTEEFLANLLSIGMKQDQAVEKGYEFALALVQSMHKATGFKQEDTSALATMMLQASELVKDALPGAYQIMKLRNRMR